MGIWTVRAGCVRVIQLVTVCRGFCVVTEVYVTVPVRVVMVATLIGRVGVSRIVVYDVETEIAVEIDQGNRTIVGAGPGMETWTVRVSVVRTGMNMVVDGGPATPTVRVSGVGTGIVIIVDVGTGV
jgi:hypothetical protein